MIKNSEKSSVATQSAQEKRRETKRKLRKNKNENDIVRK